MKIKTLYKYERENGGITVSINKPEDREYDETSIRLIADENKMLTQDGVKLYSCIDVDILDSVENTCAQWYEVDAPVEGEVIEDE